MKKVEFCIDFNQKTKKINPIWNFSIGSCHAYTMLRSDLREQLKQAHEECGFKYIRFHGLFMDQMNVVYRNYKNELEFSFFNIDNIYDYLLSIGVKPFVELSFMPEALASEKSYVFRYKGNITPPKNYEEWNSLIEAFIKHIIDRYGLEEVKTWFFEVWNEPNLGGDIENLNTGFFMGSQEDYFKLYENTARSIKKVCKDLRVGGPASSNNQWIPDFINFCEKNGVPLDFISTHHYPTDVIFGDGCQAGEEFKRLQKDLEEAEDKSIIWEKMAKYKSEIWKYVPKDATITMSKKARLEAKNYPLYYTEQSSLSGLNTDGEFGAAYIVKINLDNMDNCLGYSYWCLSDIFEESFQISKEYHGGFGLFTYHGVSKAPYNAYKLLNKIEGEMILGNNEFETISVNVIKNENKTYVVLSNYDSLYTPPSDYEVEIKLSNFDRKINKITKYIIDKDHSNAYPLYEKMNKNYLNNLEINELKNEGKLYFETINNYKVSENNLYISLKISGFSAILFEIE